MYVNLTFRMKNEKRVSIDKSTNKVRLLVRFINHLLDITNLRCNDYLINSCYDLFLNFGFYIKTIMKHDHVSINPLDPFFKAHLPIINYK